MISYTHFETPLGPLLVVSAEARLRQIVFPDHGVPAGPHAEWRHSAADFLEARRQMDAYFSGELERFDLPLAPQGTPFQQTVWRELLKISYGETISYGELARRIGNPKASRAVGSANGSNPIPIVIPCHRVIGSDGKLTGYGGGLKIKEELLALERRQLSLLG